MIKEILKRAKELGTIELIYTVADWCDKRIEGLGIFTRKAISDLEQNGLKLESLLGRLQKSTEKEIENVRTSTNKEVERLDTKDLELEEKTVKIEEAVTAVNEKIDEYPTQNIIDDISLKLEALQLYTDDVADDLDKKIGKVEKIKGERGKKGEKGDKGDKGDKGNRGLKGKDGKDGKDGSPDTPKGIKEKLETLKGDKRLDASAIKNIPISIGGGARAFTALKDTPSSYDGSGGKLVKVKADGTGLEFGDSGEVDETDPVWTSEKVNYYTKTESDNAYEPLLPATPTNPAIKYLNGNKEWTTVSVGGGGFSAPVYFTTSNSDITGYKKLSYIYDPALTELSGSITNEEKLLRTYVYDYAIDSDVIDAGLWVASFKVKVDKATGVTQLKIEPFLRHADNTETVLFEAYSTEIDNTDYEVIRNESPEPAYECTDTDRFGVRVYAKTTSSSAVTVYTTVGDGDASYIVIPIAFRHNLLRSRDAEGCHPIGAITDLQFTLDGKLNLDQTTPQEITNYKEMELFRYNFMWR